MASSSNVVDAVLSRNANDLKKELEVGHTPICPCSFADLQDGFP